MSVPDLNEMSGLCYLYQENGFDKIQINAEHAIEILTKLIDYEVNKES